MTYSVLGYDASNGDLGVAVQSKFPGVGSLVPYGEAEVGVVATQGFGNPRHGSAGLMLLRCGATPQQAVDVLLNGDSLRPQATVRTGLTGRARRRSHGRRSAYLGRMVRQCYGPWLRRTRERPCRQRCRRAYGQDVRGRRARRSPND